jgi:putative hydrolase of the HAD superfamily
VRAIVFDLFGTLTDPRAEVARESVFAETAHALGVEPAVFWTEVAATWRDRITGKHGGTLETLRVVAARCGVAPYGRHVDDLVRVHLAGAERLRAARAGALGVLDELRRRGFRLGLVSDCSSEVPEGWAASPYAGRIDAAVLSWQEGRRKPDPRLYATVADQLGVRPEACWYVGDGGGRELTGAAATGMQPVLVTNGAAPGAAACRADPDDHVPAHAIDDLPELLALVGVPRPLPGADVAATTEP